jgi:hypothetical protein
MSSWHYLKEVMFYILISCLLPQPAEAKRWLANKDRYHVMNTKPIGNVNKSQE